MKRTPPRAMHSWYLRRYPIIVEVETVTLPSDIANLAGWWDASSLSYVTLDGSNQVSQLNDRSGNSRHLAQATSTYRPPWTASARNNLGAYALDNSDDLLETSVIAPTNWIGSGTEVTIMTFGQFSGGRFGFHLNTARTGGASRIQSDAAVGWVVDNGGSSTSVSCTAVTSGNYFMDVLRWTSGQKISVRRYTGGTYTTFESASAFTSTFATNLAAFVGRRDANGIQGYRCEMAVWARRLTDAEVDSAALYIPAKWGSF